MTTRTATKKETNTMPTTTTQPPDVHPASGHLNDPGPALYRLLAEHHPDLLPAQAADVAAETGRWKSRLPLAGGHTERALLAYKAAVRQAVADDTSDPDTAPLATAAALDGIAADVRRVWSNGHAACTNRLGAVLGEHANGLVEQLAPRWTAACTTVVEQATRLPPTDDLSVLIRDEPGTDTWREGVEALDQMRALEKIRVAIAALPGQTLEAPTDEYLFADPQAVAAVRARGTFIHVTGPNARGVIAKTPVAEIRQYARRLPAAKPHYWTLDQYRTHRRAAPATEPAQPAFWGA